MMRPFGVGFQSPGPAIELRAVHKRFGALAVLNGVDLAIQTGEVVVICGPSGSGKSTLIRLVNRLEAASSGEVFVRGIEGELGAWLVGTMGTPAGGVPVAVAASVREVLVKSAADTV